MIEINLLPEEFRYKKQKLMITQPQVILYILIIAFGLFIVIHLYLAGLLLVNSLQHKTLYKRWTQLSPQLREVNQWKRQYKVSTQQTEQMNRLLTQRITVSNKMQVLTQALPNGVWFNHLNIKEKEFKLWGSVVSLNKDHMRLLNVFLNRLKENELFFKDFIRLELGKMSMRTIGGYSVMDFALEGDLINEED